MLEPRTPVARHQRPADRAAPAEHRPEVRRVAGDPTVPVARRAPVRAERCKRRAAARARRARTATGAFRIRRARRPTAEDSFRTARHVPTHPTAIRSTRVARSATRAGARRAAIAPAASRADAFRWAKGSRLVGFVCASVVHRQPHRDRTRKSTRAKPATEGAALPEPLSRATTWPSTVECDRITNT
jgi:hypothetical protein